MGDETHGSGSAPRTEATHGLRPVPRRWLPFLAPARVAMVLAGMAALGLASPGLAGVAVAVLALAALLPAFEWVSGLRFPLRLHAGILLFSAATLVGAEWADGYEALPALDLLFHAVSAAVLAVVGFGLAMLATGGGRPATAWWVLGTLAFGFAMMVGAMWELLEFGLDQGFGLDTQEGLEDTMTDVLANALGATWGAWAAGRAASARGAPPPSGLLRDVLAANPVIFPRWGGGSPQGQLRGAQARSDGALQRGGQPGSRMVPREE